MKTWILMRKVTVRQVTSPNQPSWSRNRWHSSTTVKSALSELMTRWPFLLMQQVTWIWNHSHAASVKSHLWSCQALPNTLLFVMKHSSNCMLSSRCHLPAVILGNRWSHHHHHHQHSLNVLWWCVGKFSPLRTSIMSTLSRCMSTHCMCLEKRSTTVRPASRGCLPREVFPHTFMPITMDEHFVAHWCGHF